MSVHRSPPASRRRLGSWHARSGDRPVAVLLHRCTGRSTSLQLHRWLSCRHAWIANVICACPAVCLARCLLCDGLMGRSGLGGAVWWARAPTQKKKRGRPKLCWARDTTSQCVVYCTSLPFQSLASVVLVLLLLGFSDHQRCIAIPAM